MAIRDHVTQELDTHPTRGESSGPAVQRGDSDFWLGGAGQEIHRTRADRDQWRSAALSAQRDVQRLTARVLELETQLARRAPR